MIIYRPASQTDLSQAYDVFYQNEIHDTPVPRPPAQVPSDLYHIFETGSIYVAEQDGTPHPALASLLNLGFHITYLETFLSTATTPFSMHVATSLQDQICSEQVHRVI